MTRSRSSATTSWRRSPPTRRSARRGRAPDGRARSRLRYLREPRAHRGDAARAAADRPRRAGHRARAARATRGWREHRRRCERILAILADGPRTAFEIAGQLWPRADGRRAAAARRVGGASATSSCCSPPARSPNARRRRLRVRADRHGRPARRDRPAAARTAAGAGLSDGRRMTARADTAPPQRGPVRPHRARGARHRRHARPRARRSRGRSRRPAPTSWWPAARRTRASDVAAELRAAGRPGDRPRRATSGAGTTSSGWSSDYESSAASTSSSTTPASRRCTRARGRHRGAVRQGRRRQPQGPVPALARSSASAWSRATAARSSTSRAPERCGRPRDIVPYAAAKAGLNAMTVGVRGRARAEGARQRDHARPVPDDDLAGLGHGRARRAHADVPAAPRRRWRRRSPARRCTWRPTPRATRPARSSPSTAARSGACRGSGDAA